MHGKLAALGLALLALAPTGLGAHSSPYGSFTHVQATLDWTSATHTQGTGDTRLTSNVPCFGHAMSNLAFPEAGALVFDLLGPFAVGKVELRVPPAGRPECPSLTAGGGVLTYSFVGQWEDHGNPGAYTFYGHYTLSGTGVYGSVTGRGEYTVTLTGPTDADSGHQTLLDGAVVGSARY